MLINASLQNFLNQLAGNSATPGGGSVAALNGAMGAALVAMVANLTIGKQKYADVEAEMQTVATRAAALQQRLAALVDEDTTAFDQVMAAFKLPKSTAAEKATRREAIQAGYQTATLVPLQTAQACAEVLSLARVVAKKGNANAASDAGMGALAAQAGLKGAALNVLINLGSIKDAAFVAEQEAALQQALADNEPLTTEIYQAVQARF